MLETSVPNHPDDTGRQIRRRRHTADRCAPLDHNGVRDPDLDQIGPQGGPSSYGMTPRELFDYGQLLRSQGWQDWELAARLVDPRELQHQLDEEAEADLIVHPWKEYTRV